MKRLIMYLIVGIITGLGLGWIAFRAFHFNQEIKSPENTLNRSASYKLTMLGNPGVTFQALDVSGDGQHIWLGGTTNTIKYSADSGHTWQIATIPVSDMCTHGIHFLADKRIGWAVGHRGDSKGIMLKSVDGGATWQIEKKVKTNYMLQSITFSTNNKEGVAVGNEGDILLTHDGGETWEKQVLSNKYEDALYGISIRPNNYYATWGKSSTLNLFRVKSYDSSYFFYTDSSDTLKKPDRPLSKDDWPSFHAATFDPYNRHIVVADDSGCVLLTRTGGKSWSRRPIAMGRRFPLRGMWFDSSMQQGWIVSAEPAIFHTTDGGESWTRQYADTAKNGVLWRIQFAANARSGWACGSLGILLHTSNAGRTWQPVSPFNGRSVSSYNYTKANFADITCATANTLLTAGSRGTILKSIDNGQHWQRVNGSYTQSTLRTITSMPNNWRHIWAAGYKSVMLESKDGGDHWQINKTATDEAKRIKLSAIYRILFFNDGQHGIAVGNTGRIIRTVDGGATWQGQHIMGCDTLLQNIAVASVGGQALLFGNSGTILRSQDYGEHWQASPFVDQTQNVYQTVFTPDFSCGYIVTGDVNRKLGWHLYQTTTQGRSWSTIKGIPLNSILSSFALRKDGQQMAVAGDSGLVMQSNDSGLTWFKTPRLNDWQVTSLTFDTKGNLFGVSSNGVILGPGNPGIPPQINNFTIDQSGNKLYAKIEINDPDTSPAQRYAALAVSGKFDDVLVDSRELTRYVRSDSLDKISWPAAAFISGQRYSFTLSISDGGSIVTRIVKYQHGVSLWQQLRVLLFPYSAPEGIGDWTKLVAAWATAAGLLYALTVLLLYAVAPWQYVRWHEAVAASRLPKPEQFSQFLALFLITTPRSLDAFVQHYQPMFDAAFDRHPDTQSRSEWVPAPLQLGSEVKTVFTAPIADKKALYTPGLTEISQRLGQGTLHDIIIIEGPGGVGKTSLALQLARWARKEKENNRLYQHIALPLLLQHTTPSLDQAAIEHLRTIIDETDLSQSLAQALLRTKRILVVVDGITEIPTFEGSQLDPNRAAVYTKAVIYTARRPLPSFLQKYNFLKIRPLGIDLASLDLLLDGMINVVAGGGAFGAEREILRNKIKRMMESLQRDNQQAPLPLTFVRLMIVRADELRRTGQSLDILPHTLTTLLDTYLEEIFRNDDTEAAITALREAALISLNVTDLTIVTADIIPDKLFRPQRYPIAAFTNRAGIKVLLPNLLASGVLVEDGSISARNIRFSHDPVAEFCVSRELILRCQLGQMTLTSYDQFIGIAEKRNTNVFLFMSELRKELV